MNKNQIKQKIEELSKISGTNTGWHQRINLNGVYTTDKKVTTSRMWKAIYHGLIREDLKNKKILDVGCNAGLFCIEATKLGAIVTGVESKVEWWRQAKFVKEVLCIDYHLILGCIDDIAFFDHKFDYIIATSVLRYIGTEKFGFPMINELAKYQVEYIKVLSTHTDNFIIKCRDNRYDNIDFWSGVLVGCGFFEDSEIYAYPNTDSKQKIKRFKKGKE